MPITFHCACGKALRVPDAHAGKRVKCPACAGVSTVPHPKPMFEVVEDVGAPPPPPPPPKARPVAKPVAKAVLDEDDEDDEGDRRGYAVPKSRRDDEDEGDRPRPKKKKKPKWKEPRAGREPASSGPSPGAQVGGGLLLMLIAVVWFVAGLIWLDRIFFYPPILFICGVIGVIKGLAGSGGE